MEHGGSGLRSEDEDFEILRERIIEGVCEKILSKSITTTFHGIEMVKDYAGGFFDKMSADEYEFSGDHPYYRQVLERIYRPLIEEGLMVENENNNFIIPHDSRLRDICRRQLSGKTYIKWDDFWDSVKSSTT
jgi:hypothetical protein